MSGLKTAVLLAAMSGLFLAVGAALGGQSGLVLAFGFALVMNFVSYWFSDKIVLRMYRAQEVSAGHRLFDMTARLARRAELPMPKVYVIPDMSPNAFATGRNPNHAAVAATEGIQRLLSDSELEGVIAHELGHIKNRDILISSVAATLAAAITFLARSAMWFGPGDRDRNGSSNAIVALVTMLLARCCSLAAGARGGTRLF
jgi:heat shock protein HtpX